MLAVKLDGEKYKGEGFPSKLGHIFKGYDCGDNKEVNLVWDKNTWSASLSNIKTKTTCILEFETKTNLDLDGSEPVIKEGLVPVVIADNGIVTKTETDDINWYDYNESKWANAVILTGTDIYQVGDRIPEEAIESYFVWIPKYRYKLFNVEGNEIPEQEIDIKIGDYDTVDDNTKNECVATNKSRDDGTCKNDMWMTHPAFTSLGVNGIWVGKFETTGAINALTVKPNVTSLRSQTVGSFYNAGYNYKRDLDSHMMKNTEWGAMAYLTNSKYGRGNTEVTINSNSSYITGCTNTTTYFSGSVGASTTNNYSGVYDTNGGAWEYVVGNTDNKKVTSEIDPSIIPDKYIDRYIGPDVNSKILGDTISEAKDWNGDFSDFNSVSGPWFRRGGCHENNYKSGIFAVHHNNGDAVLGNGFRLVLSPTN